MQALRATYSLELACLQSETSDIGGAWRSSVRSGGAAALSPRHAGGNIVGSSGEGEHSGYFAAAEQTPSGPPRRSHAPLDDRAEDVAAASGSFVQVLAVVCLKVPGLEGSLSRVALQSLLGDYPGE